MSFSVMIGIPQAKQIHSDGIAESICLCIDMSVQGVSIFIQSV